MSRNSERIVYHTSRFKRIVEKIRGDHHHNHLLSVIGKGYTNIDGDVLVQFAFDEAASLRLGELNALRDELEKTDDILIVTSSAPSATVQFYFISKKHEAAEEAFKIASHSLARRSTVKRILLSAILFLVLVYYVTVFYERVGEKFYSLTRVW